MNYSKNYLAYIEYVKTLNRKRIKKHLKNGLENPAYVYYERHHVIPRACGGSNDKNNLVLLTAREHFLAHYLLMKIYYGTEFFTPMQYAFFMMSSRLGKKSSKAYKEARLSLICSLTGKKRSKESCEKSAEGHRGRLHSVESRENMSKGQQGRITSEATRKKQRATHKNLCTSGINNPSATMIVRNDGVAFMCMREAAEITFPNLGVHARKRRVYFSVYKGKVYDGYSFQLVNTKRPVIIHRNDGLVFHSFSEAGRASFPNVRKEAAIRRVRLSIEHNRSYAGYTFTCSRDFIG